MVHKLEKNTPSIFFPADGEELDPGTQDSAFGPPDRPTERLAIPRTSLRWGRGSLECILADLELCGLESGQMYYFFFIAALT